MELFTQRWRERRDSYRPAGEPIQTSAYDVAPIAGDAVVKAFVERHHYSGTYPAARERFGLYRQGALVGVAVFSVPASPKVLTNVFQTTDAVELGRFVLLDDVPANGESWFLARAFEKIRAHYAGVVSFSDPLPRHRADGSLVTPGHVGTIYQACNATYLGRGTARPLHLFADGTVFSDKAAQKIRDHVKGDDVRGRGWQYATAQLEAAGAPAFDGSPSWLGRALASCTTVLRHPGNHRYGWSFTSQKLTATGPYPKKAGATYAQAA